MIYITYNIIDYIKYYVIIYVTYNITNNIIYTVIILHTL